MSGLIILHAHILTRSLVFQLVEFARNLTNLLSAYVAAGNPRPRTAFPSNAVREESEDDWARRRRLFDEQQPDQTVSDGVAGIVIDVNGSPDDYSASSGSPISLRLATPSPRLAPLAPASPYKLSPGAVSPLSNGHSPSLLPTDRPAALPLLAVPSPLLRRKDSAGSAGSPYVAFTPEEAAGEARLLDEAMRERQARRSAVENGLGLPPRPT